MILLILQLWASTGILTMVFFIKYHDKTDQICEIKKQWPQFSSDYIRVMLMLCHFILIPITMWFWPKFLLELLKQ